MTLGPRHMGNGAVCLTGDVHHMSLRTRDQRMLHGTEAEATVRYLTIAERWGLPVTLFITGRLVEEERDQARKLKDIGRVDFGGHCYDGFYPPWLYNVSAQLLGLQNGPAFWQDRLVGKTKQLIENCLETDVRSWRNHAYRHDRNTPIVLKRHDIVFWSDFVEEDSFFPYNADGLVRVPINTVPDHDHMVHGALDEGFFARRIRQGQINPEEVLSPQAWGARVLEQVERIVGSGGVATILCHPACMAIADNFMTFNNLCRCLARYRGVVMREVLG